MPKTVALQRESKLEVFNRETLIKGKPAQVACVEIGGQTFTVTKGPLTVVQLQDEWYEDVRDPEFVIDVLINSAEFKPDIFTMWQRVPERRTTIPISHGVGIHRCPSGAELRPLVQ